MHVRILQKQQKNLRRLAQDFARCEDGATAIEYGLIAALVGVMALAGISAVGRNLNTMFQDTSEVFSEPARRGRPPR